MKSLTSIKTTAFVGLSSLVLALGLFAAPAVSLAKENGDRGDRGNRSEHRDNRGDRREGDRRDRGDRHEGDRRDRGDRGDREGRFDWDFNRGEMGE